MAEPKRLPNGRWQIRYRDAQGRSRSKVCDTKAEARNFVQDVGHAGRARQSRTRTQPDHPGGVVPAVHVHGRPPAIFSKRHWQPARQAAGLDGLRFHDLRHTAVALAVAQGAHPKAIPRRMGHSTSTSPSIAMVVTHQQVNAIGNGLVASRSPRQSGSLRL